MIKKEELSNMQNNKCKSCGKIFKTTHRRRNPRCRQCKSMHSYALYQGMLGKCSKAEFEYIAKITLMRMVNKGKIKQEMVGI